MNPNTHRRAGAVLFRGGAKKFAQIFHIKLRSARIFESENSYINLKVSLLYFINQLYIYNMPLIQHARVKKNIFICPCLLQKLPII